MLEILILVLTLLVNWLNLNSTNRHECPEYKRDEKGLKRSDQKKIKSRNFLDRLMDFEDDLIRFMDVDYVPFTNNLS